MNTLMQQHGDILDMTLALRHQLMEMLTDADLAYQLPGKNMSLGALCREMGEVDYMYIDSFKTLKMDYGYRTTTVAVEGDVAALKAWYAELEADLKATLHALTDEDLGFAGGGSGKIIDRGFPAGLVMQFHIYREALLIFYGKVSIYLKALNKPVTEQWQQWIG